ncbi:MAG: hypothetical protein JWM90_2438 [Thermoleophilia bacterium]|nr:hypothetical protein [Thermoleophilia bacterium]
MLTSKVLMTPVRVLEPAAPIVTASKPTHWDLPLGPSNVPIDFGATRGWELLRHADDSLPNRDSIEHVLTFGTDVTTAARHVSGGVNGKLPVLTFEDAAGQRVDAVIKTVGRQGGAQEVLAYQVGRALHVDHLLARVGRRPNGDAAMEFVPGTTFEESFINDSTTLEHALRDGWALRNPGMDNETIRRHARIDRQLVQVFDNVTSNSDRHTGNAMFDAATGRVSLIDHGYIGWGGHDVIARQRPTFLNGLDVSDTRAGKMVELLPEVRGIVERANTRQIEAAYRQFLDDTGTMMERDNNRMINGIRNRIDYIAATGKLQASF